MRERRAMVSVQLPMPLVALLVGGLVCASFVGVMALILVLREQNAPGGGSVAGSAMVAAIVVGVFYGVGWAALRFL